MPLIITPHASRGGAGWGVIISGVGRVAIWGDARGGAAVRRRVRRGGFTWTGHGHLRQHESRRTSRAKRETRGGGVKVRVRVS